MGVESVASLFCSLTAPRTISILIAFTMYLKHWRQRKKGQHTHKHTHTGRELVPLVENRAIKNEGQPRTAYRQTDRSPEHLVIIPVDKLPLAGLSYPPQPPFQSSLHPSANPSAANFIPGISPCLLVYLVIFLGGEMVKYRLLLLIIGLTGLGRGMLVPPSLPTAIQRWRKRVKKWDEEGEKEHLRKCRCCDAGSTGKWPQSRSEGESKSGAWWRSALVVPAGQCKLFSLCIKEKEGGREGGETETEVPHSSYPPPSLLSIYCTRLMFCNAYLSVPLPDFCHSLSVWHFKC